MSTSNIVSILHSYYLCRCLLAKGYSWFGIEMIVYCRSFIRCPLHFCWQIKSKSWHDRVERSQHLEQRLQPPNAPPSPTSYTPSPTPCPLAPYAHMPEQLYNHPLPVPRPPRTGQLNSNKWCLDFHIWLDFQNNNNYASWVRRGPARIPLNWLQLTSILVHCEEFREVLPGASLLMVQEDGHFSSKCNVHQLSKQRQASSSVTETTAADSPQSSQAWRHTSWLEANAGASHIQNYINAIKPE